MDDELTHAIIGCAFKVHRTLGPGFLEKVYERALLIELRRNGLKASSQVPVDVYYEGEVVGEYFADLLVEEKVICELKAMNSLTRESEVQLVHYLMATGLDIGLLINFGTSVGVKRKYRTLPES